MAIVMYAISAVGLAASIAAFVVFSRDDRELARQEQAARDRAQRPAR